jgi:hypothetical protein
LKNKLFIPPDFRNFTKNYMTNQERITQLKAYKLKEKFLLEDLEEYETEPPPTEAVIRMRKEVDRFTDFLIKRLVKNVDNIQEQTQQFFKDWDNEEFTDDETEFIVEVEYEAMRIAGVKADDLLI